MCKDTLTMPTPELQTLVDTATQAECALSLANTELAYAVATNADADTLRDATTNYDQALEAWRDAVDEANSALLPF